jgi:diaminopropionate ammonia-lyase
LIDLPTLAAELGIGRLLAKDESARLGLPAFKALGASWAIARLLREHSGPVEFVTATDGNHGRAVARFAGQLGHTARIFIPDGVHPQAVQAIANEGAAVEVVGGRYDEAVAAAANAASATGALLVQDTAWEGYHEVPGWIVEGYATLFAEIDQQVASLELPPADLIVVPAGVGSLLQSALAHYRRRPSDTAVLCVEPDTADCVRASLAAGEPVEVRTGHTIMAGLNCGTVSTLAWPYIHAGLDAAVAISDADDMAAMAALRSNGVDTGPCGASGLAALRLVMSGDEATGRRQHLGLGPDATAVIIITEGGNANPAGS